MFAYFAVLIFGVVTVYQNSELLPDLLSFVGMPTSVAIGVYAWKAKAENIIKLKQKEFVDEQSEKLRNEMDGE